MSDAVSVNGRIGLSQIDLDELVHTNENFISGSSNQLVKHVLLNGKPTTDVVYCDPTRGVAIKWKRTNGDVVLFDDGRPVYELFIGSVELVY